MDADHFDGFARLIGSPASRRLAVGLIAMGLLGTGVPDAAAVKCSKQHPCPKCKKCKHHRCKPDATKNGNTCAPGKRCLNGTCTAKTVFCRDGVQNGDETDINCGGTCPRCANLAVCQSRDDCASAHCHNMICEECPDSGSCELDTDGAQCFCDQPATTTDGAPASRVCDRKDPTQSRVSNCNECAPGTTCVVENGLSTFNCYKLCGTPS
jgi:hypothetical protein